MSVFELLVFKIVLVQVSTTGSFVHNIFRNFFGVVKLVNDLPDINSRNQENAQQRQEKDNSPDRTFKIQHSFKNNKDRHQQKDNPSGRRFQDNQKNTEPDDRQDQNNPFGDIPFSGI